MINLNYNNLYHNDLVDSFGVRNVLNTIRYAIQIIVFTQN